MNYISKVSRFNNMEKLILIYNTDFTQLKIVIP
jgi:hypothetical protein